MYRLIILVAFFISFNLSFGQVITYAEYFIDNDPGFGNGVSINITPNDSIDTNFTIPTASLTQGFHSLYIRVLNSNGMWSFYYKRNFYIQPAPIAVINKQIVAAEYFIDSDPGFGNGIPINVTSNDSIDINLNIPTDSLSQGFHSLYIRVLNSDSLWSLYYKRSFYIQPPVIPSITPTIIAAEYFFDTDPGVGNGIPISVVSGDSVEVNTSIPQSFPIGSYTLNVRVQNSLGVWSMYKSATVDVCHISPPNTDFNLVQSGTDINLTNTSTGDSATYVWHFGNGDTSIATNPNYSYTTAGIYNVCLTGTNPCGTTTKCDTVVVRGLSSVFPTKGGNNGNLLFRIYGGGFTDSSQVKLTKAGSADIVIPDSSITLVDGGHLITPLFLLGVDTGYWDVVVTIPGDTTMALTGGFKVELGVNPRLDVNIIGPSSIRFNQWQDFHIIVNNNGNTTALAVPLFIVVSSHVDIEYKFGKIVNSPSDSVNFDTIPVFSIIDSLYQSNLNNSYYVFPLILSHVNPNENKVFTISIKSSNTSLIELSAWATQPLIAIDSSHFNNKSSSSNCQEDKDKVDCIVNIATSVLGGLGPLGCAASALNAQWQVMGLLYCEPPPIEVVISTLSEVILDLAIDCSPAGTAKAFKNLGDLIRRLTKAMDGDFPGAFGLPSGCGSWIPPLPPLNMNIPVVTSFDPNEKYGPQGTGASNYINLNSALPYQIAFENVDSATAAAQIVMIIDTLDQNVFDLSTFQLGFVQIADSLILIPPGHKNYVTEVDLRPGNDLIVKVESGLDMTTGVATWTFTSLDPITMQPTTDPLAGFLPPNVNEPEGEGSVFYTIKTWDTLSTNTEIKNKAYIFFDYNPPIVTNEWSNTMDHNKPISQMDSLPPVQYNDSTVTINWSGNDVGSGVFSYKIYYAVNNGPFEVLASHLTDTTLDFTGYMDSTYSFFSIATDSAGNVEDMKTIAEATVSFINVGVNDNFHHLGVSVFPNPNSGIFNVEVISSTNDLLKLSVVDLFGRTILENSYSIKSGKNTITVDIAEAGFYMIVLENKIGRTVKRVIVKQH